VAGRRGVRLSDRLVFCQQPAGEPLLSALRLSRGGLAAVAARVCRAGGGAMVAAIDRLRDPADRRAWLIVDLGFVDVERHVALRLERDVAIRISRLAALPAVGLLAVGLNDQALGRPQEVDSVTADPDLAARLGQGRRCERALGSAPRARSRCGSSPAHGRPGRGGRPVAPRRPRLRSRVSASVLADTRFR